MMVWQVVINGRHRTITNEEYERLNMATKEQKQANVKHFKDTLNKVCEQSLLYEKSVSPDAAVEANRQALLDRSNVGIVKYGTTLMDNKGDLRYWLNHALEECLDQANYLRRAIMEIDNETK